MYCDIFRRTQAVPSSGSNIVSDKNFSLPFFEWHTKMPQGRGEKTDNQGGNSGLSPGKGRKWGLAGWKNGTLNRSGIPAGQSCMLDA